MFALLILGGFLFAVSSVGMFTAVVWTIGIWIVLALLAAVVED